MQPLFKFKEPGKSGLCCSLNVIYSSVFVSFISLIKNLRLLSLWVYFNFIIFQCRLDRHIWEHICDNRFTFHDEEKAESKCP